MTIPQALMADVNRVLNARDARPRAALPDGRGQLRMAVDGDTAEMLVYDEIGFWGVTARDVTAALAEVTAPNITVRINSPGGDVFDGIAIFNSLRGHPAAVNVVVDGIAASAASFIAMAGDRITMNDASQMMIHDASGMCMGNAADMEQMRDLLDRLSDTIAGIYTARAGGTTPEWRDRMRAETWFDASEAVAAGLADEADTDTEPAEAVARFDLTCFAFAGRAAAPAPVLPTPEPDPVSVPLVDVTAVAEALRGAFR